MFGKKDTFLNNGSTGLETVIGPETLVQGTISSKGSLRVDGRIEGGVTDADSVVIGDNGEIQGDISARSAVVSGKVVGNISANTVEVLAEAQIHGDIKTANLAISEGAAFEGNCTMVKEKNVIEMEMNKTVKSGV